jgi:SAM-dependent methyltransferase
MKIDFGRTRHDYAQYRASFPNELFERLVAEGVVRRGMRLLDLGTGTGALARAFARLGARVTALDTSRELLETAEDLGREAGVAIRYLEAPAEATGLENGIFHVVSAGQCWHWFDRPRAAAEARRLLTPGGRLVIAHFDWLPQPGNVVEASERLIRAHNPAWSMHGGIGVYPEWLDDLTRAGFADLATFSFDCDVPYTHDAWRGRIRASAGVGASLDEAAVRRFDLQHAMMLSQSFPEDPLAVPHRCWVVIGRKP